jgi:Fe-S-cluster containining protein
MSKDSKLRALYAAIPSFTCKPGCSDCCGVVPLAKPEWQAIKLAPRADHGSNCMTCDYLIDNKCSVYADRPFLCRLFGATTSAKMRCPHGCGPDKPLSAAQADSLNAKYMKLMNGAPAAFTADITKVATQLGAAPAGGPTTHKP